MFDVCGRTWFAARYVVRIRTSSITPLTFMYALYGWIAEPTQ
jgi:hypothetical protein